MVEKKACAKDDIEHSKVYNISMLRQAPYELHLMLV
jgi:hypothetical protein